MLHVKFYLVSPILLFIYSVVEFAKRDDMKYALRVLDGGKLNDARITIEEAVSPLQLTNRLLFTNFKYRDVEVEDLLAIVVDLLVVALVVALVVVLVALLALVLVLHVLALVLLVVLVLALVQEVDLLNVVVMNPRKTILW